MSNDQRMTVSPEILYGIGTIVLLGGLGYAAFRAGSLTRAEKARTDAATRRVQREEELSGD